MRLHRVNYCGLKAILAWMCMLTAATARADAVTEWNAIMQATVTAAPSNPNLQTRWGAIVQLAVYEAVNTITGDYEPYLGVIDAPEGASLDAAVIAAAYSTLAGLRPSIADALNLQAVRDAALDALPDDQSRIDGILVGEAAAAAMLALRENDGWNTPVPYEQTPGPGVWQPLPGQTPVVPQWGLLPPFALVDSSQFRLPPPPKLHTRKYADDYNEVKQLGRIDSPFRPQDRTDVARLYAVASPVQVWNSAARQVSAAEDLLPMAPRRDSHLAVLCNRVTGRFQELHTVCTLWLFSKTGRKWVDCSYQHI
jgi:hypothetical protein